jgi:hypothetical protein
MAATSIDKTEQAIWARLLDGQGALPQNLARAILELDFPSEDKERRHRLAAKARDGALSPGERADIDTYGRVGSLLSVWKSKARQSLRKQRPKA